MLGESVVTVELGSVGGEVKNCDKVVLRIGWRRDLVLFQNENRQRKHKSRWTYICDKPGLAIIL